MRYPTLGLLLLAGCTPEFEARKHYDTSTQPIWTECKQEVGPESTSTAAVETQKFHATEEWQSWHLAYDYCVKAHAAAAGVSTEPPR